MKINLHLDENNIITSWTSYPLNEETAIEIDDPYSIRLGFDKYVDGQIIKNEENYQKSLQKHDIYKQITELKDKLTTSDYKLFKYLEGELSSEEYELIKRERQEWRNQINQLEEELK